MYACSHVTGIHIHTQTDTYIHICTYNVRVYERKENIILLKNISQLRDSFFRVPQTLNFAKLKFLKPFSNHLVFLIGIRSLTNVAYFRPETGMAQLNLFLRNSKNEFKVHKVCFPRWVKNFHEI